MDLNTEIKVKIEEEDLFNNDINDQITSNDFNGKEILDEYLIHESTEQEEIHIKNEEGGSQFSTNVFNEKQMEDEYVSRAIKQEEIDIKGEEGEGDQFSTEYEESSTQNGERKYCCDKCSYETKRKNNLVTHIRIHDKVNVPKYSCNQCPYQTINKSHLKRHLRTHNCFGLICVLCQKSSFKQKGHLDAHYVSKHPDRSDKWGSTITNKINHCSKCNYKTVGLNNFKKHLLTHEIPAEQARFNCKICGHKSIPKSRFVKHLGLHGDQMTFECTECDKKFNLKRQLDGHIISRHSENEELVSSVTNKVYQCDKCDYKTVWISDFKNHLYVYSQTT